MSRRRERERKMPRAWRWCWQKARPAAAATRYGSASSCLATRASHAQYSGLAPALALDGLSARKSHELVLLGHGMVAVLQPHLVHDHHAQSRRADRRCAFAR